MAAQGIERDVENAGRPRRRPLLVYFVQAQGSGRIKIGIARDMLPRLTALQTGSPVKLSILGVFRCDNPAEVERALHQTFRLHRTHGEWFEPHPDLLSFVERNAVSLEQDRRMVVDAIAARLKLDEPATAAATPRPKGRTGRMAAYLAARGLER